MSRQCLNQATKAVASNSYPSVAALHSLVAPVGAFMAHAVLPCALSRWHQCLGDASTIQPGDSGLGMMAGNLMRLQWQAALRTEACLASNSWQLSESKESYVGGCGLFVLMLSHAEMAQRHRVMEALHAAQLDTKKKSQVRV